MWLSLPKFGPKVFTFLSEPALFEDQAQSNSEVHKFKGFHHTVQDGTSQIIEAFEYPLVLHQLHTGLMLFKISCGSVLFSAWQDVRS